MPLPSTSIWGQPPAYILSQLQSSGFADANGNLINGYRWNPDTMSVEGAQGSYSFAGPDPSQGSQIVTNLSDYNSSGGQSGMIQLAPGENPYFGFGDSAQGYDAGLMPGSGIFASANPAEIAAYKDHARTQALQGVAKVGALVGGAALGGSLGGGGNAGATGSNALTGVTVPASATPIATGGAFAGMTPAATGSALSAVGTGSAAGAAGAAAGAGGNWLSSLKTAIGAGGTVSGGSGLDKWLPYITTGVNSLLGYSAAGQAADAESAAAQAAIAEQRRQYDQNRTDLQPWMTAGQSALNNLTNPGTSFQQSPGYQWTRDEGQRDIGNSFAARGGAASGNALRALSEFNQGLASNEYNNWWNQQAGLAGVGQNAATNLGATGANTANSVGNYLQNQGAARASGVVGKYGSLASGLNEGVSNWLYSRKRKVG